MPVLQELWIFGRNTQMHLEKWPSEVLIFSSLRLLAEGYSLEMIWFSITFHPNHRGVRRDVKILSFWIEILSLSNAILSFSIAILEFFIEILPFFIEAFSLSIEILSLSIEILSFSIKIRSFSNEKQSRMIQHKKTGVKNTFLRFAPKNAAKKIIRQPKQICLWITQFPQRKFF